MTTAGGGGRRKRVCEGRMVAAGGGGRRKRCRLLRSGSRSQVPLVVVAYAVGILGFQLNVNLGEKKAPAQQHQLNTCEPLMHTELHKRVGGSARPAPS